MQIKKMLELLLFLLILLAIYFCESACKCPISVELRSEKFAITLKQSHSFGQSIWTFLLELWHRDKAWNMPSRDRDLLSNTGFILSVIILSYLLSLIPSTGTSGLRRRMKHFGDYTKIFSTTTTHKLYSLSWTKNDSHQTKKYPSPVLHSPVLFVSRDNSSWSLVTWCENLLFNRRLHVC